MHHVFTSVRKELLSHQMDFHEIWYEYFPKTCPEYPRFIQIGQITELIYMKTNIHF